MKYNIKSVSAMRGFEALTQGEERIENWLLANCNELNSKIKGLIKTRSEILEREFDYQSLKSIIDLAVSKRNGSLSESDKHVFKYLLERVYRDHVARNMVEAFVKGIYIIVDKSQSIDKAIEYLQSNATNKIANIYNNMCILSEEENDFDTI
ncbi:hypothetical protein RVS70_05345 [Virgibacillus sp. M23]|uniref:hypothetical protein n=1 Tax=Virgibacillus sp. M23 TaxID=3079030 RepID=UPI002A918507|nr:hypothetical protein [Virgibacillus sp. M23]MDY7043626.1 hypothetical protein [Virgibacillus sp. M23]